MRSDSGVSLLRECPQWDRISQCVPLTMAYFLPFFFQILNFYFCQGRKKKCKYMCHSDMEIRSRLDLCSKQAKTRSMKGVRFQSFLSVKATTILVVFLYFYHMSLYNKNSPYSCKPFIKNLIVSNFVDRGNNIRELIFEKTLKASNSIICIIRIERVGK